MAGKLRMVTNDKGERVPFYAADGKGKMKAGGLKQDIAKIKADKGKMINFKEYFAKNKPDAMSKNKKAANAKFDELRSKYLTKISGAAVSDNEYKTLSKGINSFKNTAIKMLQDAKPMSDSDMPKMKGGGIPPQLREYMKKKKKTKKKKNKMMKKRAGGFIQSHDSYIRDLIS